MAWIDPKTGNKQQKHDFVDRPLVLKKSTFTRPFRSFRMEICEKN